MGVQSKEVIPPWGLAVAGASGAVLANALVYPLDMYVARFSPKIPWILTDRQSQDASPSPGEEEAG
jgi:hypothetical protein